MIEYFSTPAWIFKIDFLLNVLAMNDTMFSFNSQKLYFFNFFNDF